MKVDEREVDPEVELEVEWEWEWEAVGVLRVISGLLLRVGVGEGVISVEGETSTSSASRYHLRRRVYRPQPSTPRRPFCH